MNEYVKIERKMVAIQERHHQLLKHLAAVYCEEERRYVGLGEAAEKAIEEALERRGLSIELNSYNPTQVQP